MRASCLPQLHSLQLRSYASYTKPVLNANCRRVSATRVLVHAKSNQKNDGVYFEYEAVDPDAANELAEIEDEVERQFEWSKQSRRYRAAAERKHGAIDRRTFGVSDNVSRRKGKGAKRRANALKPEEKAALAAEAAALSTSLGPILPDFSPVQTPAMRAGAQIPEPQQPAIPASPQPLKSLTAAATTETTKTPASAAGPVGTSATSGPGTPTQPPPRRPSPKIVAAATGPNAAESPAGGPGSDRRQRLLQRVKGGGSGGAAGDSGSGVGVTTAAGNEEKGNVAAVQRDAVAGATPVLGAELAAAVAGIAAARSGGTAAAAGLTEAAAEAYGADASSLEALGGDDLSRQLSDLLAQLPPADQLPLDAQPARALIESILRPSLSQELASGTGEQDAEEAVLRDMSEEREFREWLRATQRKSGGGGGSGLEDGEEEEGQQLTSADAAKLAEALAGLEDVDFEKAFKDLGLDLDSGNGEGMGSDLLRGSAEGQGGGKEGNVMKPVSELKELMAMLEKMTAEGDEDLEGSEDMNLSDEQVLATLRTRDPQLYELLKDVPKFDDMDLDLDLRLDLDDSDQQLSADDLAELSSLTGVAGGGGDDLAALLQEMRGLGLMEPEDKGDDDGDVDDGGRRRCTKPSAARSSKAATVAAVHEEDDDEDDDDDEGDLAPGDLLQALVDEDDSLDPQERLKAQFALSSIFNQPADELTAKGSRSGGSGGDEDAGGRPGGQKAGGAKGRGNKGEGEGGPPPPPLLPKPTPRRQ